MFKDLGAQMGYRTVFFLEYLGPLLAFPVLYLLRPYVYGHNLKEIDEVQKIAMLLFVIHFIKREFETLFIHKFSNATMPFFNFIKNGSYYTGCALFIAYFVLHPLYTSPPINQVYICSGLFLLCMLGNFYCHIILSNLRSGGSTGRSIPRGFLFEYTTCPNYFLEISEWVIYFFLTQSISSLLFALLGGGQMLIWAIQKYKRYKIDFDGKEGRELYPKNRTILIPFIY